MIVQLKPQIPNFLDLLHDVKEFEERAKDKEPGLRHYPSSASYKKDNGQVTGACLRQVYWRAKDEPETDKKKFHSWLQAGFGDGIHDWLLNKWIKNPKIKLSKEASGRVIIDPLTNEVSFRLDGLVTHKGEKGGLEIKTQQTFAMQRILRDEGPKESDLLQILSYFATNEELQWFGLCYFGRDTGQNGEYHIYPEINEDGSKSYLCQGVVPERVPFEIPFKFDGVLRRWKELELAVESDTLPPRDYKAVLTRDGQFTEKRTKNAVDYKSDWRCSYCSYKTKCWTMPDAQEHAYKIPA